MEATYFGSVKDWRKWLTKNHESCTEIWVGLYKKGSGKTGITYDEAVEQALCFGWIDGLTKGVDEKSYKIRFTPRRPKSNWSTSNINRVELLIKNNQMTPAGLKHIESAKSDGRWKI